MGVKKRMAFLLAILSVLACAFSVSAESGTDVAALQDTQLMASSEITVGDITYSISDVEATVIGISGSMSSVSIPARITSGGVTYTVVAIADDVGSGNDKITSISFLDADNLLSIGENCFSYCTSLETVSFIDGGTKLESIGNYAFYYCPKLKSVSNIDTQNSLQKVGASVFGLTPFMSSLTEEFVMFGNVLIKYNGDAKNVVVPQGTVAISDAFYGKDIVSINFGTSLKYVGDKAFYNCKELESVVLPSTCKSVGDMAFSGCSSLKRVTYAEGLTNIGFCSFANCDALFSFVYGGEGSSNLTEVGEYAFWNDRRLFYFDIGEIENVNIGAFWNCFGETPDEVGSVYYYRIPETVKSIAEGGFGDLLFSYVTVPESIQAFAPTAFGSNASYKKYIVVKGSKADTFFANSIYDYIHHGDMNTDGKITAEDIKSVAGFIAKDINDMNFNYGQGVIADNNGDNNITTKDLYDIFRSIKEDYEASLSK